MINANMVFKINTYDQFWKRNKNILVIAFLISLF